MNAAPKQYDEEFYRRELDGQKQRLITLKSRQEARQTKYGGNTTNQSPLSQRPPPPPEK
jgi:hypothetical protein